MKLHECKCPPCFKAGANLRGQLTCSPACDLGSCNLETGACAGAGGGSSGGKSQSCCYVSYSPSAAFGVLPAAPDAASAVLLSCADGTARLAASGANWRPFPPLADPVGFVVCAGGGAPVWSILLSVVVAVAVVGAAAYGLYQFRLRSAMHQVRRASSTCMCMSEDCTLLAAGAALW